jgi:acylphosphatase
VRNEDNGTVLLEVQGNADVVEAFLNELRREMGRFIKNEASAQVAIVAEEPDFSIRR